MHASIRKYRVGEASIEPLSRRVADEFVPIISQVPGFVSYMLIVGDDGVLTSVSIVEDEQAAERSNTAAAEWVRDSLSDVVKDPPEVTVGEVTVSAPQPAVW